MTCNTRITNMHLCVQSGAMVLILLIICPYPTQAAIIEVTKSLNWTHYYCQFCACFVTNDGPFVDCSKKGLFNPPKSINTNTTVLLLYDNLIKGLKYEYFQGLDKLRILNLSENPIDTIEVGTFRDLSSLEVLILRDNKLIFFHRALKAGIFTGLSALKILDLRRSLSGPLTNPVSLREAMAPLLNLEELYIDGFRRMRFDESFYNFTKLTTLIATDDASEQFCALSLTRYMFEGLIHLRNLTIRNCRIHSIEVDTFWGMSSLGFLDLSNNVDIGFNTFGKFTEGLEHTNLTILYLNSIHAPYKAGSEILRENVRYLRRVKLTELHMDNNGIEYIEYGVFNMLPETLKFISMRRNRLHFLLYMYEVVFNNPTLEVFDAGGQHVAQRSDRRNFKELIEKDSNFIAKLPAVQSNSRTRRSLSDDSSTSVEKISRHERSFMPVVHKISLKKLICSGSLSDMFFLDFRNISNVLDHIDISENFAPVLNKTYFENLKSLKYLNLSSNYIEYVHSKAFHDLDSLEILDLHNNLLGNVLSFDVDGDLFNPLENLKHLNLSKNIIFKIGKNVLHGLDKLVSLDLADNYISNIDIEFKAIKSLRYLNLRNNQIQSFSSKTTKTLSEHAKTHSLSIDLSYNILACNCETIPFMKWLFQTDIVFIDIDKYYCSLNNGSIRQLNQNTSRPLIDFLEEECASYLGIIVGSVVGGSFLTAFVTSYLIYMYRWKLRYLYYMAKIKLDRNHEIGNQDHKFDYDVFLSYGDGDRVFVTNCMVENMEVKGGLRLNIRDRDFEIGETIAVNISKAIRTSKRTFLLLSRHFLRNKWCNFEMNMALMESLHTKREVLVLIFLEDIPSNALTIDLINILKKCPSTDVPKNDNLRHAFWHKCIDFCR